jgi:hypothetical protein
MTLNGCALQQRLKQRDAEASQTRQTIARTQSAFEARTNNRAQKLKAQQVEKPWLASRAVPLSREVTLPAALRAKVNTTMLYRGGKSDLVLLAERITQATGVPVQIKPEALLPAESFLPRLSVGTMTKTYSISFKPGRQFGVFEWMKNERLFSTIIAAQQQLTDQLLKHKLAERYLRLDEPLGLELASDVGLDIANKHATQTLLARGSKTASDILATTLMPFLGHEPQLKLVRE